MRESQAFYTRDVRRNADQAFLIGGGSLDMALPAA